jgi:hypothetical protein
VHKEKQLSLNMVQHDKPTALQRNCMNGVAALKAISTLRWK